MLIFTQKDQQSTFELIKANRQKLQTAKADREAQQGKAIGRDAFRRFLKAVVDDTNGFASE